LAGKIAYAICTARGFCMSAVAWNRYPWAVPSSFSCDLINKNMTEYESDDDDRTGGTSADLMGDDFDFDINHYTSHNGFLAGSIDTKKIDKQRGKSDGRGMGATSKMKEQKVSAGAQQRSEGNILCRICGDSAVRHVHYGGHCCFSCKAFFRRAVNWQNKNNRNFQCKFESKCEITIKNRKTCQACRFKKCMTTGMNPSWVLSDEQRKKRFKKYRDASDDTELSPASSQDSEREVLNGMDTSRDLDIDNFDLGSQRRRAKSAQEPLHRLVSPNICQPRSPPNRFPRVNRLSGPPVMGIAVPVIKMEKDQFEMSPLRDDCFSIDFNDQHKYLGDEAIKIEPDIDLDLCLNESLGELMENYQFEKEVDVKPDIANNKKDFNPTVTGDQLPVPSGICLQLSEGDMMHIYKIEMSFENSNNSIPVMSEETGEIWNYISKSCQFNNLSQSFTSSLLTEAVEFSLRRNLIFLQENSDFTALSLKDRKNLYNRNMGSMCHVRAVMQHTTKHDFLVRGGQNQNRTVLNMTGQQQNLNHSEHFEICYKNHKTGKIRRWNLMELPFEDISLNRSYQDLEETDNTGVCTGQKKQSGECQKKSLLHLAESLWSLELERTSYLILLLVVLFSSQGGQLDNLKDVDKFQNQYMMLLFRYLQAKHGQEKVHQYLSKIMTFVLNLLTNAY